MNLLKAKKMPGKSKTDRLYWLMTIVAMLIIFSCPVKAQDTTVVKGVVYSNINQPLANVSVSIAGSLELPEVTNEAGEFSVLSTSGDDWLIFSPAADYKVKRVYRNSREQLVVYLTPLDMVSGDDPVQIMGRPVMRRNIAAAYTAVNIKDITSSAVVTVDEFIQGRAAGLNVVRRSGQPGSGAFVTLRGINSLNAGNQPLFVIDGVPVTQTGIFGSNIHGFAFNPLVELSPFDISAVNVIKDPAVSAAYGSRGSNGLVLVETLDPSVTKTVIELDLRTGISLSPAKRIPQLDALQHKSLMQEVLYTSGKLEEDIILDYPTLFLEKDDKEFIDYQHNTNWQDEIFHNAIFNNLNINVKGGDEIATYGLSFGLIDNKGTIRDTELNGYNLRFVSRLNVFRWLKMNAGVSINYNRSSMKDGATSQETSPILTALGKSPLLNPYQYDEQGNEISALSEVDGIGVSNPVAVIEGYDANNINQSFVYSMGLDADINSRISLKSKFNLTYNTLKENIFMPNHGMEHYYNDEAWNVAKAASDNLRSFFNNTYLSYNRSFGENHNLSSMTGFNIQTNEFEFDWQLTKNSHISDQYRTTADGQANLREIGGQNRKWNWLSVYENLFYTYKDKFLINASISFDGSSRIGKEATNTLKLGKQPFGLFYSAGLAWRLSSESFLKNKPWLEDLKWRLSYGKTGNDDIGESSATNYYTAIKFRETVGLYPAVITNDELTYESVSQVNTGIDIALWGSRVTASVDLFQSQTKNMLIFSPVNAYLGYDYRMENSGKMKNTGFEVSGFVRIVETPELKWDVYLNLSQVKNEVVDIKG
ncbi:MAG: SusC/RagA family TonB-linked outer membrane protein, partial [Bacteroidales bacterium]|nr:SusC/RagA family TonB-linked outer membrane protein [Bacteroidales bacterium]